MFELFKKKKKQPEKVKMQLITVKKNKEDFNCFKGKFVSVDVDTEKDNFYFTVYDNENNRYIRITEKVDDKYYTLCDNYEYGLIYDYTDDFYTIAIICCKGYIKALNVKLNEKLENGTSFIIDHNNLIDNNKIVGSIQNNNNNIKLNVLDHNKLMCFIEK